MKETGTEAHLWSEGPVHLFPEGEGRDTVGWEKGVLEVTDLEIHHFIWFTNSRIEHYILQSISGGFYVINTKLQCLEQEMDFKINVFHMD